MFKSLLNKISDIFSNNGWEENGIHKKTKTKYDLDGYNISGYNKKGYDRDAQHYSNTATYYNNVLKSKNGIIVAILSKVAKADGTISINESKYISNVIDDMNLHENVHHVYSKKIIEREKDRKLNISELCGQFRIVSSKGDINSFINKLIGISKVNNKFDEKQFFMICDILDSLMVVVEDRKKYQIQLLEKLNLQHKNIHEKIYKLKLEKELIVHKTEQFEAKIIQNIGKIQLELLSLKQNSSKEVKDEYNNYLKICDKYKDHELIEINSNIKKPKIDGLSDITTMKKKIKNGEQEINTLKNQINRLKENQNYRLSLRVIDEKRYFQVQKEKLEKELEELAPKVEKKGLRIVKKATPKKNKHKKTNTKKDIEVPTDKELKNLKIELKSLESNLQNLVEQKTEYLNDIEEFNREYNLHLGELIKEILSLKKEILYKQTIKQQKEKKRYEEDLKTFDDTKETIDELKSTIDELEAALESIDKDHEQYNEIYQAYKELQDELKNLEFDLNTQGENLNKTKEFIEDEDIKEEYEEVKSHHEEYENQYNHIQKEQDSKIQINDEEKKELKKLFRKAARLCHPDIVIDNIKDKAHDLMQKLNVAYSKQDLLQVKAILHTLESGKSFEVSSEAIEDKELLKQKIQKYKSSIKDIGSELDEIKEDDTYQTISSIDSWDEYFEELKSGLKVEKKKLENEAIELSEEKYNKKVDEVLKAQNKSYKKNKEKPIDISKENSSYTKHIQFIENLNFEKIRRYCNNLSNDNRADNMQKHLANNGKMHKAIIYDALEQFAEDIYTNTLEHGFMAGFYSEPISIIDWGCDQGIASMLVLDYIKEKQLDIKVSDIILIDNDTKVLSRAMAQVEALAQDDIEITALKSNDNNLYDKIKSNKNNTILHLFANDNMPIDFVDIDYDIFDKDFVLCVSNENKEFVDEVYEDFNNFMDVQDLSIRDGKIGRFKKYERIFKITYEKNIPTIDIDNDEIPF